jgi:hypothetical protein
MGKINIVTSICVDVDKDEKIFYPQLKNISADDRRLIYWKCVYVFCATSVRCNPDCTHQVYTNDTQPVVANGVDLLAGLKKMGVEIVVAPFGVFNPPKGYSNRFKNAFYKLDVIHHLGQSTQHDFHLLLDSDCVWVRNNPKIYDFIAKSDTFTLYDVDDLGDHPEKDFWDMSRQGVWDVFKSIEPDYPENRPILFGGEAMGGSTEHFRIIADELKKAFDNIVTQYDGEKNLPKFPNSRNIFSGMEYFTSMVYNRLPFKVQDIRDYLRRIWTSFRYVDIRESDMKLTIWHMPSEKQQGFLKVFKNALNPDSKFWKIPINQFDTYLGEYLGVPYRTFNPKRFHIYLNKVKSKTVEILTGKTKKPTE